MCIFAIEDRGGLRRSLLFYYQENFDLLWALGAELEFFSPMKDGLAKSVISEKK